MPSELISQPYESMFDVHYGVTHVDAGGSSSQPLPRDEDQHLATITQTMIGEFLYKYTRKSFSKGHSDQRHKRFFWIHPYTKTLYWSSGDPGSASVTEQSAKSGQSLKR